MEILDKVTQPPQRRAKPQYFCPESHRVRLKELGIHFQSLIRSCGGAVLFAVLTCSLAPAQTRQTPHEALLDLYFSESPEAAERHLLNSTKDQLRKLDPSLRQSFFDLFMVRRRLEKAGVVSKRGHKDHTILLLQAKAPAVATNVTLEKEEITGDEAEVKMV